MMCSSNIMKRDGYSFLSLLAAVAAQTPQAIMDVTPDLHPREIASWFADSDLLGSCACLIGRDALNGNLATKDGRRNVGMKLSNF